MIKLICCLMFDTRDRKIQKEQGREREIELEMRHL